jgi:acyl-CoA thioester hydrolase
MLQQHETTIRVRYSETDAMGFLHHANYLSYFEVGRTDLFRAQGGDYRALEASGLFFVVVKVECKYYLPARYDDLLSLRTTLKRISPAKLEHTYEVFRDGTLLAKGETVLACVDREGRVRRISDAVPELA